MHFPFGRRTCCAERVHLSGHAYHAGMCAVGKGWDLMLQQSKSNMSPQSPLGTSRKVHLSQPPMVKHKRRSWLASVACYHVPNVCAELRGCKCAHHLAEVRALAERAHLSGCAFHVAMCAVLSGLSEGAGLPCASSAERVHWSWGRSPERQ